MLRIGAALLGIGALVMGIAGFWGPAAVNWLCLLDFIAAIGAFGASLLLGKRGPLSQRAASTAVLTLIGLLGVFVIPLDAAWMQPWQLQGNFVLFFFFLVMGLEGLAVNNVSLPPLVRVRRWERPDVTAYPLKLRR